MSWILVRTATVLFFIESYVMDTCKNCLSYFRYPYQIFLAPLWKSGAILDFPCPSFHHT